MDHNKKERNKEKENAQNNKRYYSRKRREDVINIFK